MTYKDTYFLKLWDDQGGGAPSSHSIFGLGECALFRGLSADDKPDYEERLRALCTQINTSGDYDKLGCAGWKPALHGEPEYSSIRFGLETALADLRHGGKRLLYPSDWTRGERGIKINGLVWMGSIEQMTARVEEKLAQGFRCIKFKIGGQDFDRELALITGLRERFSPEELEIRLDANGAFSPDNALERLERLAPLTIHSIEQPIKPRQWEQMARICSQSPIPIALDEELIGITHDKDALLDAIKPQYIILKPSLCGGIAESEQWIEAARRHDIGWWVTSALESNVGLNMLAQWVSTLNVDMPQGLGTGALYVNNIPSPLWLEGDSLRYGAESEWIIPQLPWIAPGL